MDATKSEEGDVVVKQMKSVTVNDALWKNVRIREDVVASTICILLRSKAERIEKNLDFIAFSLRSGRSAFRPLSKAARLVK